MQTKTKHGEKKVVKVHLIALTKEKESKQRQEAKHKPKDQVGHAKTISQ